MACARFETACSSAVRGSSRGFIEDVMVVERARPRVRGWVTGGLELVKLGLIIAEVFEAERKCARGLLGRDVVYGDDNIDAAVIGKVFGVEVCSCEAAGEGFVGGKSGNRSEYARARRRTGIVNGPNVCRSQIGEASSISDSVVTVLRIGDKVVRE